jgi:thymidine kinase
MSALNGTYEKKGWANILELIPLCEKVKKLSAICKICATNANYTFRTCAGSSQEMIGGADMYMPLCRECFNEKTKQQNMAKMILHSESKSVSTDDGMTPENQLIDMR